MRVVNGISLFRLMIWAGYPFVNGQAKGGDLPVEHAGNMLIMVAAMAKAEKDASYAKVHW